MQVCSWFRSSKFCSFSWAGLCSLPDTQLSVLSPDSDASFPLRSPHSALPWGLLTWQVWSHPCPFMFLTLPSTSSLTPLCVSASLLLPITSKEDLMGPGLIMLCSPRVLGAQCVGTIPICFVDLRTDEQTQGPGDALCGWVQYWSGPQRGDLELCLQGERGPEENEMHTPPRFGRQTEGCQNERRFRPTESLSKDRDRKWKDTMNHACITLSTVFYNLCSIQRICTFKNIWNHLLFFKSIS